jgi:pimeloyl-ACP methyl ester carboxylesterase
VNEPLIVYLHGANSTPRSFNHVVNELPYHSAQLLEYSHDRPIMETVERFARVFTEVRAKGSNRPINLVGHSLGGVVAVALAQRFDLCGGRVATISAPFGGSKIAALMRWMMPCQLFDDIHPSSPLMNAVRNGGKVANTMAIVSTSGASNLMPEENDGVVSVASQIALSWPSYVKVPVNHFESLLCDDVLDLLNGHLFQD